MSVFRVVYLVMRSWKVLFRWIFGHLKQNVSFLAHFFSWISLWQLCGTGLPNKFLNQLAEAVVIPVLGLGQVSHTCIG